MEKIQEKLKELAIGFQELLECPVCFDSMDSTLKLCVNGHGICNSCATKIEKCPSCNQEIIPILRQNTLLGQLLQRLPKLCPYTDEGCDNVMFEQEHPCYCEYRPTQCLKSPCDWEGCAKDLLDHVRNCKRVKSLIDVSLNFELKRIYNFDLKESKTYVTPIVFQNQVFWKFCHRDSNTKIIYHQLYNIPTSKQRCNYYLVVSFKNGDKKFEHYCRSTFYVKDENFNNWSGLVIPDCEIKRFLKAGCEEKYEYTITFLKEDISQFYA